MSKYYDPSKQPKSGLAVSIGTDIDDFIGEFAGDAEAMRAIEKGRKKVRDLFGTDSRSLSDRTYGQQTC